MRAEKTLSKHDFQRLQKIMDIGNGSEHFDRGIIEKLRYNLTHSRQVEPKKIKPTVVTMNSKFVLTDLGNGKKDVFSLVFPQDSDIEENRISVLSGIGEQLLGCSIGAVIKGALSPNQYLLVENIIYQPEAAGDYYL